MQARIGIDLVRIPKMEQLTEDEGFLARAFHPSELGDRRPQHLAGILAAKEALFKALGAPSRWLEAEVRWDQDGRPRLGMAEGAAPPRLLSVDLSITHEGEYAVAAVVALLGEEETDAVGQDPA